MKKLLLSTFCLPFALNAQPTQVQTKTLRDYFFIGEGIDLKSGVNFFAVTTRKQFNRFFGETNRPDTPNFSKEIMLVMVMPASNHDAKLSFDRVDARAGNFIEVYCNIQQRGGKLPYTTYPLSVCAIPKYADVKKLRFYNNKMRLIETVDVK